MTNPSSSMEEGLKSSSYHQPSLGSPPLKRTATAPISSSRFMMRNRPKDQLDFWLSDSENDSDDNITRKEDIGMSVSSPEISTASMGGGSNRARSKSPMRPRHRTYGKRAITEHNRRVEMNRDAVHNKRDVTMDASRSRHTKYSGTTDRHSTPSRSRSRPRSNGRLDEEQEEEMVDSSNKSIDILTTSHERDEKNMKKATDAGDENLHQSWPLTVGSGHIHNTRERRSRPASRSRGRSPKKKTSGDSDPQSSKASPPPPLMEARAERQKTKDKKKVKKPSSSSSSSKSPSRRRHGHGSSSATTRSPPRRLKCKELLNNDLLDDDGDALVASPTAMAPQPMVLLLSDQANNIASVSASAAGAASSASKAVSLVASLIPQLQQQVQKQGTNPNSSRDGGIQGRRRRRHCYNPDHDNKNEEEEENGVDDYENCNGDLVSTLNKLLNAVACASAAASDAASAASALATALQVTGGAGYSATTDSPHQYEQAELEGLSWLIANANTNTNLKDIMEDTTESTTSSAYSSSASPSNNTFLMMDASLASHATL